ncbi:hypothetical protein F4815DRAFT_455780 [Daldinia loculata]|nr:hypothetical protein F4815DRAFT_455780 [Daldinia loculata]
MCQHNTPFRGSVLIPTRLLSMDAFPCDGTLGYTPPGGDDSAVFYEPRKFLRNGTANPLMSSEVPRV